MQTPPVDDNLFIASAGTVELSRGQRLYLPARTRLREVEVVQGLADVHIAGLSIQLAPGSPTTLRDGTGLTLAGASDPLTVVQITDFRSDPVPAEISPEWIESIPFVRRPVNVISIEGVLQRLLTCHLDGRGDVIELWSAPWTEDGFVYPSHVYQSATDQGVVKCWHLHRVHTDQFAISRGKVQVTLADLRPDSPTFGEVNALIFGEQRPGLLKIPPGIMHGWKALSGPEIIVFNLQSHVYDSADEIKIPWDLVLEDCWEPRNG